MLKKFTWFQNSATFSGYMVLMPDYYRGKTKDPFTSPQEETKAFLIQVMLFMTSHIFATLFDLIWNIITETRKYMQTTFDVTVYSLGRGRKSSWLQESKLAWL